MSDKKFDPKALRNKLTAIFATLRPYILPGFLVFVGLIYASLLLRVNSLVATQPSETEVTSQVKAAKVPYIDEKVVDKLKSLKDNSSSVNSYFIESRINPFQ